MKVNLLCRGLLLAGASTVFAQTAAETTSITQSAQTVENRAASVVQLMNAPTKPANWRDIVLAEMDTITASVAAIRSSVSVVASDSTAVPPGANLQTYLDNAQPGDTIILQAGAVYTGNFILRNKQGSGWITITTSGLQNLPDAGKRVRPSDARYMAKLVSPNTVAALDAAPGAHHYRIVGLELAPAAGVYNNGLLRVGAGTEASLPELPRDFEIDRVYIHGDPQAGSKRGIALNGIRVSIKNSWISDIKSTSQDSQAICGWNGPGPFTIENNYLEASGENVFFSEGGVIRGVYPSDIVISGNHITKPVAWRTATAPNGQRWLVKNLLELKAGKNVRIEGNILENSWLHGQLGFAINLKAGPDGKANTAVTDGVLIVNNIIRHAVGAVTIQGHNNEGGYTRNVTIRNNFLDDLNENWGGWVNIFGVNPATTGIVIENNTASPTVAPKGMLSSEGMPGGGLVFRSNILPYGTYGVKGASHAAGLSTLNYYWPGYSFSGNVMFATTANPSSYPAGNYFAPTFAQVGLTSTYTLSPTSPYLGKGWNGRNPGADYAAIQAATATALSGGR